MEKADKIKFGDCHVHMILDGEDFRKAIDMHKESGPIDGVIRERLQKYKDAGVTFLRDGGDAFGVCGRAKELASEYEIDYRSPAFPIYKKGHYGAFIGRGFSDMDEYRALVDEAKEEGADFIKLMISGIMDFDNYGVLIDGNESYNALSNDENGGLSPDEIQTMIDIAHDEGFAVMAHCNGAANIRAALAASADSIEHGAYMDDECIELLSESDTVWVPTVAPIANLVGCGRFSDDVLKQIVLKHIENINRVWTLGGMIALGTDAGAYKVPHTDAIKSEYTFLKNAINDKEFEMHLLTSQEQIAWRFKR